MTVLPLLTALALAAPATAARNARPRETTPAPAASPETSPGAAALSDEEVAARVRTYLGAIDTPIRAAQWQQLGARAVPQLEAVVRDPEALPSRRAKAVEALSIVGGTRARETVLRVARDDGEPFGVRASAVRGAARLLQPKELGRELRPVLENAPQVPLRATAAEVLALHGGNGSCAAVRAQAARERAPERAQFGRALERCGHAPAAP